jgi:uncharacterized membrane protein YhiD involved in acid resistance
LTTARTIPRKADADVMHEATLDILLQLSVAALCAVVMSLPTCLLGKIETLRAHILVAMGAALFCITAERHAAETADALRAAYGIAYGVALIGAAAMLRARHIRGFADGVSLWSAAAVGCSAGFGDSMLAFAVAAFVALLNVVVFTCFD